MIGTFDAVVVGGGIAGAAVAAELAVDRLTLLIEAEPHVGYHSTGRSAALFSEIYGCAQVRALSRASRDFLFAPPSSFADAALVSPRGSLFIATNDQLEKLERFANLADVAPAVRWQSAEAAVAICPLLKQGYVQAAVLEPNSHDVDVHGLHQGYLRCLRALGGSLNTNCRLVGLDWTGAGWAIETTAGRFFAKDLVNAAGAWADEVGALAGAQSIGLRPLRRTALTVDAPGGTIIESWPVVIDIDEQFYFKPEAGQLLLSPADETLTEPCDAQPDEWDVAVAVDRVQTATNLIVSRVNHRWAGLRSFVSDRTPVVGFDPLAPSFFWLAGQGGYGIQTAPALGRMAASLIRGEGIPNDLIRAGVVESSLSPRRLSDPQVRPMVTAPQ